MTRVYLPATVAVLRALQQGDVLGTPPLDAYAVTSALRETYPEADDEEREYAASADAGDASLRLLASMPDLAEGELRRVVVACDVADHLVSSDPARGLTGVRVAFAPTLADVASVLCDDGDAETDIRDAVVGLQAGSPEDDKAIQLIDSVADHELLWFATQEIVDLVR